MGCSFDGRRSRFAAIATMLTCFVGISIAVPSPAFAACIQLKTPADLTHIHSNLSGSYCLANDIDATSLGNFVPIGPTPFLGHLDGQGFVIRNLKINRPSDYTAFITWLGQGATIANLGLVNANITGTERVAILVGLNEGTITASFTTGSVTNKSGDWDAAGLVFTNHGVIEQSHSDAKVTCLGPGCTASGLATENGGTIRQSFASGNVSCATDGCTAAGLVWDNYDTKSVITDSYFRGSVSCQGYECTVAGLVWSNTGSILRSVVTGNVSCIGDVCNAIGLAIMDIYSTNALIQMSYATGSVTCGGNVCVAAGLSQQSSTSAGFVKQSYATGHVSCSGTNCHPSGLNDSWLGPSSTLTAGYWDTQTTGQNTSTGGGTGLDTATFKHALPAGFAANTWSIDADLTYPWLDPRKLPLKQRAAFKLNFWGPPLASAGYRNSTFYYFYPIGQLEEQQYHGTPKNKAFASKAAIFTMLARAAGDITGNVLLINVPADTYFWVDKTKNTAWKGPVTGAVSLYSPRLGAGPVVPNDANVTPVAYNSNAVLTYLTSGHAVLLRGTSSKNASGHWMLATGVTKNSGGAIDGVVAHDPWTGGQVIISTSTWRVTYPAGYEKANFVFTATGYFYATIN